MDDDVLNQYITLLYTKKSESFQFSYYLLINTQKSFLNFKFKFLHNIYFT